MYFILKKMSKKFLILDTETTGLNISLDNIIEISCFEVCENSYKEVFTTFVKPKNEFISLGSSKIHGITWDDLKNAPSFKDISRQLIDLFKSYDYLVMHNADFDVNFLNASFRQNNIKFFIKPEIIIDTLKVSYQVFGEKYSLDNLCRILNFNDLIEFRLKTKHRASVDTMILSKCFIELRKCLLKNREREIFKIHKQNWWE